MDRPGSGFRRLTGLLLVLNIGMLIGGLGLMHWPVKPGAMLEFNGDKVRFLSTPTGPITLGRQMAIPVEPPPASPEASNPTLPALPCLSWNSLDTDRLLGVESHLKQAGMPPGSYELQLAKRLGWWVYLPPFGDQEALRAAMEEARQKGVTDMAQVRAGKMANAVSLGAFPNLESARAHAAVLVAKGLRSVKFGTRPEAGEVRLVIISEKSKVLAETLTRGWPRDLQPTLCEVDKP